MLCSPQIPVAPVFVFLQILTFLAATGLASDTWFVRNDPSWVDKLSQPRYDILFEHDVKVRMRDGVRLSANIWRPKAEGKFPIIFVYMPYDNTRKSEFFQGDIIGHAQYFVPRGYVFACIDVRGRYDSEGESYLYWDPKWREGKFDGQDVYDCQTWLGEQPWSTGKIGMCGGSYLGFVQWMGATEANRYLTALIPYVTPDDHWDNVYPNGAFQLSNSLNLLALLGNLTANNNDGLRNDFLDWDKLYRYLPIRTMDQAIFGQTDILWQDLVDHPDNDHYWRFSVGDRPRAGEMSAGKYAQVQVPTLNITGWYDQVSQSTINGYLGMVRYGPEEIRDRHRLLVGPWRHGVGPREVGDLDYGPEADVDFRPIELRWYDYWLKGIDNGMMDEPRVDIFVMGDNKWRGEHEWPLSRSRNTKYYLHSEGRANSRFGNGTLSTRPPSREPADVFVYDPDDPVPTYGGNVSMYPSTGGPRDQRAIQRRDDVLVFTGEVLRKEVEVTGRVLTMLHAASSAADTDFTAKLVDIHPNGYAQLLAEGIIRARYRDSFKKQILLEPGKVYEYTIDLWSISHVFKRGHRIQLEISSSNFPKYDRNPNTGHKFGEDAELRKATQTVHHDADYPSHIVLPVIP